MDFLNARDGAQAAVYKQTEKYKSIPKFTLTTSTYERVFNSLKLFDAAMDKKSNAVIVTTRLLDVRASIENWMAKPAHLLEFSNSSSTSSKIKPVFEQLQNEVDKKLAELFNDPSLQNLIGKSITDRLVHELVNSASYSACSNPLLVYVLNRFVAAYTPQAIKKETFQQQLFNYIVADNDLRGAYSLLFQALGNKSAIKFSIDFGKLILPFLKLSLDLGAAKTSTSNEVVFFDCLATDFKENGEDHRYGFYRMYGWQREYEAQISLTAGISFSVGGGEDPLIELEIAGVNALPSIDPPGASAGVEGSVKVNTKYTVMQVADRAPRFFTSLSRGETVDFVMQAITTPIPESYSFNNKQGAVLYIYSNGYGTGAEASATGKASAPYTGIEISASAGIKADIKKSSIIFQAPAKSIGYGKKTQITEMWFKQIVAEAGVKGAVSLQGKEVETAKKEASYNVINSISYTSVTGYWDFNESAHSANTKYLAKPRSGHSRGQSLTASSLSNLLKKKESRLDYCSAVARQLGIDSGRIIGFLDEHSSEILNIINTLQYYVNQGQLADSVLNCLVLEASYALKSEANMRFTLNEANSIPKDEFKEDLSNIKNLYLESIRFRVPNMDKNFEEKPGFKFGLNLGIVKFGIDLGSIEQAMSMAMTDLIIDWYDAGGTKLSSLTPATDYVPSTALII